MKYHAFLPAFLALASAQFANADVVQALTAEDAAALGAKLHREVLVRPPAVSLPERPVAPATSVSVSD